jgi:hypothetical protein
MKTVRALKYLILALAITLTCGCSRKIEGEAFIVTKDRNTIKLSLLEVFIMDKTTYDQINSEIEKIKLETEEIKKEALKEIELLHPELRKTAMAAQAALEASSESDELSMQRYRKADKERSKVHGVYVSLLHKHEDNNRKIYELLSKIPSREGLISTKTNSDGKFVAAGVSSEYGIFAQTSRSVVGSQEDYMWFFLSKDGVISLNNENMVKVEDSLSEWRL